MARDVTRLNVAALGAAYRSGTLDPVQVLEAVQARVAEHPHGRLAYRQLTSERAFAQAERASRMFASGIDCGPLHGVPVAVKDLVDMEGEVSASGSKLLLRSRPPAAEDAPVLARLDAAGAVLVGRTNMTELAYSGVGINPHFGTPPCALDAERVPGGSSSGSAVAVAHGMATVAVGSDTGGSVRIPAAVNGGVGLKTTDGLVPTAGTVPLSTTLDTIGPMARTCDDAWALFTAMAAVNHAPLGEPAERLTLLAPTTLLLDDLDPEVEAAFTATKALLEGMGHEVRTGPLEVIAEPGALFRRYGSFASHEAWALYERELTEHGDEVDPRVVHRVVEYADRPAKDYVRLGVARQDVRRRFWPELVGVDAVIAPTIPILPPKIADLEDDTEFFMANGLLLRNTAPFNFLGCPAASVPCGQTATGLSVGLMIATRPGEEELALGIARQVERARLPVESA